VAEQTREQITEVLRTHVRSFFEGRRVEELELEDLPFDTEPLRRVLPRLRVLSIEPVGNEGEWVYTTLGTWEITAGEREQHGLQEFVLAASEHRDVHLQILGMVAHYHADPAERLGVGHTFPIGRPWVESSQCDHLLVSRPYPWGPKFEICPLGDDHVHFLWLLPITKAERDFKAETDQRGENGLEELEQRFDAAAMEWWRPDRPSVV
jgi:hypothetical protein